MEYNLIAEQYHITNDIGFMKKSTKHFIINLSAYSIWPINNGTQRPINRMGAGRSSYHWIQNISSSWSPYKTSTTNAKEKLNQEELNQKGDGRSLE